MKAAEQLANVRSRLAWELVQDARRHRDTMKERADTTTRPPRARAAAGRALTDAEQRFHASTRSARRLVQDSLGLLKKLNTMERTIERESLVGSAYKRQALVAAAAGRRPKVEQNLRQMKAAYQRALDVGRKNGATDVYYPASNCLVADVALNAGRRGRHELDPEILAIVQQSLDMKSGYSGGFCSLWAASN